MNYNKEVRKSINRLNENFKNTFGPNLYMDGSFDKKSAEKILLEMIKNNVLIINYMEKMNELYNDKLLTVEVESDNYNLEYVKKYLENHDIDKLPYDLIYQINANNVIFYKLNSEIYNISVSDDKEKILDSVKKYELKDK